MGRKKGFSSLFRQRQMSAGSIPAISEELTDSGYYGEVSYRFFSAQVVCMMILAVFIAVSITTNDALLTGDNVVYFMEDLKATLSEERTYEDTLIYTKDGNNQFAVYRNGLAVLGEEKLTLFSATGRENFTVSQVFRTPRLASSTRYFAAYDLGGNTCLICNSFHILREITTDNAIRSVTVGDTGQALIITEGSESASKITLYSENQSRISRYTLREYTVCGALASDGSRLALLSVDNRDGGLVTRLLLAVPGSAEIEREVTLEETFPVDCRFLADGNLLILTTESVSLYTSKGDFVNRTEIPSERVLLWKPSEDGYALLVSDTNGNNAGKSVICIDNGGKLCYTVTVEKDTADVLWTGKTVVALGTQSISVLNPETGENTGTLTLQTTPHTLLLCEDGSVIACGDAAAAVLPGE